MSNGFFSLVRMLLLLSNNRVSCSNNRINSGAVDDAVNLCDRVCVYNRSLSLVTTRSERDSSNCYEHEYQFFHFF